MLLNHLDGVSFRNLGSHHKLNASTVYRKVAKLLQELPHLADVTRKYCSCFCGILLVDGKFVKIKGYEHKLPVIYGVDYFTHDIPHYRLSRSEGYQNCLRFFESLRLLNYPLQAIICDDNVNIYQACQYVYPKVVIQLCHNHYQESIRKALQTRTVSTYQNFMYSLQELFIRKRTQEELDKLAGKIVKSFGEDEICLQIMADLYRRKKHLFAYHSLRGLPTTTNLIECFNSHLQGRLKTIKGFESFRHANLWLNAYFLRRRTKKFTDCGGKFRTLNGKTSLEKSQIPDLDLPTFF